jgi:hypothetical protein
MAGVGHLNGIWGFLPENLWRYVAADASFGTAKYLYHRAGDRPIFSLVALHWIEFRTCKRL